MLTAANPDLREQDATGLLPVARCSRIGDMFSALGEKADAAIWTRDLPAVVQTWLEGFTPEQLPHGRYILAPDLTANCVTQIFRAHGIKAGAALAWLSEDIHNLALKVSEHSGLDRIRLRIDPVFDDACRKLHIDNVFARLICTYRGPGTELGIDDLPETTLDAVPTGMPVLLKGKRWPSAAPPRLRHRSPAIEGTGRSRLMVVLEGCPDEDILPNYDLIFDNESMIV